jgi:pimeloyl-ACP methyl ester carboxylesterase
VSRCVRWQHAYCSSVLDSFVEARDGIRLAVRDHGGHDPNLVLLHGLGEHLMSVDRLAKALEDDGRVVSMDLRWCGLSGGSAQFGWNLLVDDVETVMERLGMSDGCVVGHSLGGMVATYYAAAHPDCRGAVNIDGWGFGDPDLYADMPREQAAAEIDALRENVDPLAKFQRSGDAEWAAGARVWLRRLVAARGVPEGDDGAWVDRMLVTVRDDEWCIRPDPVAYESMRTDARVFDALERARCPVLVITSDVSTAQNETVAARRRGVAERLQVLQQRLPNLVVASIPGSGHDSLLTTHAQAVRQRIAQFLTGP